MLSIDTPIILFLISILMAAVVFFGGYIGYGNYDEDDPGYISRFIEFCKGWYLVIFTVSSIRLFLWEPFFVPSESMAPGLKSGDYILVNKLAYGLNIPIFGKYLSKHPSRGDVIVFHSPENNQHIIKRIIGLPNDEVSYFRGKIFVNGERIKVDIMKSIDQKHLFIREHYPDTVATTKVILTGNGKEAYPGPQGTWNVLPGTYFVMGDHRNQSRDSRIYGVIQSDAIVGQAAYVWMSWDEVWPSFDRNGLIK